MDLNKISNALSNYPDNLVSNYAAYLDRLSREIDRKTNKPKNPWIKHLQDEYFTRVFKAISDDGLVFDGEDITLQKTGVSYSYQAYKNKMLLAYPESIIDVQLVHKGDAFNFRKESGQVHYSHGIADPFGQNDNNVVGGYCVIKNKRGQFLTLLSRADIEKHRRVAKTDYIWKNWFHEMALKTIIKKACKQHFKDTYKTIETLDNENYDLDKLDEPDRLTAEQVEYLRGKIKETGSDKERFLAWAGADSLENVRADLYDPAVSLLKSKGAS